MTEDRPIHAVLEYLDALMAADQCDPLAAWKVRALLAGYHQRWKSTPFTVLGVEETFQLPIINPDTGRPSRTFTQGGRFDLSVHFDGKDWMVEHKSTAEDISDPAAPYWKRLAIDSQVSMYALANWQNGRKLDGTIYDVIRKPTIRPKQIPKKEVQAMLSEHTYCGLPVTGPDIVDSAGIEYSETWKLYSLRLLRDTLDDPMKYYQRRPVPRLDNEVIEWAGELWQVAKDINDTQRAGRHYRNSGACMPFGRPCDYLGICSGYDTPDSDKWRKREVQDGFGPDVLSHSRIRCYQTCRAMHNFKYNLRIERADGDEAEALVFGALLHKALEVYYLAMKDQQHGHCDTEPAASEVAGDTQAVTG
jgi:hypothetical protein